MHQTVQSKNGFTIIELLVVMAIFAILIPLGINAFVSARISREVSDVSANVRNLIKTAREMSLSVAGADSSNKWPVAYEVEIGTSSAVLNIYYSSGEQHVDWNPNNVNSFNKAVQSELSFGKVAVTSGCSKVLFSSVNGNMFVYNSSWSSVNPCSVTFMQAGNSRILTLNSSTKQFDIQ